MYVSDNPIRFYTRKHGQAYLNALSEAGMYDHCCDRIMFIGLGKATHQLQDIAAELMKELVASLHIYSAAHEVLSSKGFERLHTCSEKCRIKTLFQLDRIAMLLLPEPLVLRLWMGDVWSCPESLPLEGSEHEIYVTSQDVDNRITADHDQIRYRGRHSKIIGSPGTGDRGVAPKVAGPYFIPGARGLPTLDVDQSKRRITRASQPQDRTGGMPGDDQSGQVSNASIAHMSTASSFDPQQTTSTNNIPDPIYSGMNRHMYMTTGKYSPLASADFRAAPNLLEGGHTSSHISPVNSRFGAQEFSMLLAPHSSQETQLVTPYDQTSSRAQPTRQDPKLGDASYAESIFGPPISGGHPDSKDSLKARDVNYGRLAQGHILPNGSPQPTQKELGSHNDDKHSVHPVLYKCHYSPCPYKSKRESNCKQHMEKSHGWTYVRSKNNGKNHCKAGDSSLPTPSSNLRTPEIGILDEYTPEKDYDMGMTQSCDIHTGFDHSTYGDEPAWPRYPDELMPEVSDGLTSSAKIDVSAENSDQNNDFPDVPSPVGWCSQSYKANVMGGVGCTAMAASASINQLWKRRCSSGVEPNRKRRLHDLDYSTSKDQLERLWLQAYMTMNNPKSITIQLLDSVLSSELGIDRRDLVVLDSYWSNQVLDSTLKLLESLEPVENSIAELDEAKSNRERIIQVIGAVSGTLGLEMSALPWSCAVVCLKVLQNSNRVCVIPLLKRCRCMSHLSSRPPQTLPRT